MVGPNTSKVPSELVSAGEYPVVSAEQVLDYPSGKNQEEVNNDTREALYSLNESKTALSDRIKAEVDRATAAESNIRGNSLSNLGNLESSLQSLRGMFTQLNNTVNAIDEWKTAQMSKESYVMRLVSQPSNSSAHYIKLTDGTSEEVYAIRRYHVTGEDSEELSNPVRVSYLGVTKAQSVLTEGSMTIEVEGNIDDTTMGGTSLSGLLLELLDAENENSVLSVLNIPIVRVNS
jgi:hypothetical protein